MSTFLNKNNWDLLAEKGRGISFGVCPGCNQKASGSMSITTEAGETWHPRCLAHFAVEMFQGKQLENGTIFEYIVGGGLFITVVAGFIKIGQVIWGLF